tara:strand:+ start:1421 stop:1906 length:486 start_codon:yes stop_codon:yes gene_type:complete
MNTLKITFGIAIVLVASRFIPHPPNFTALIALSFYAPVFFGLRYIPLVAVCFAFTDLFLGFHAYTLFTWGSILLIGLVSKFFFQSIQKRLFGAFIGSLIFFIITNLGVWALGGYEKNISGLITCFYLAIPFYTNNFLSTITYSLIIELINWVYSYKRLQIR